MSGKQVCKPRFGGVSCFWAGKLQRYLDAEPQRRAKVSSVYLQGSQTMDLIRIIFAILLPPLGVFLQVGFGGAFWLNILLTLCGYIPGIVHAVYIIAKR
jgi:uncharacterized membrane protein YqaE (UPF0057 family)